MIPRALPSTHLWLVLALLALLWAPEATAGPLDAVVGVRAEIHEKARTAEVLGREREGSGVVIGRDGLVLTIGYIILEAERAELVLPSGDTVPAEVVAYDYDSGFGLLKALAPLDIEPVGLGASAGLAEEDRVLIASFGGPAATSAAFVASRRDFAGYWEYLLPDAIFTVPPHRAFGGAALFGEDGRLLGIGSLAVGDAVEGAGLPGNMFVPIDALKPILGELLETGRRGGPARPWLGLYTEELRGRLFVSRVAPEGPAAAAGLEEQDILLAVAGKPIASQADFYRKVWALGAAGVEVPLTVLRGTQVAEITVASGDRYDYLKLGTSY